MLGRTLLARVPPAQVLLLLGREGVDLHTREASFRRAISASMASARGARRARGRGPRRRGTRPRAPGWRRTCPSRRRGGPSAAARLATRPEASRFRRRPPRSYSSTSGRTSRCPPVATARRSPRLISTSKWPALASTAPSFMRSKCSRTSTSRVPVTVMNTSPRSAAASDGMTSKPSMRASRARIVGRSRRRSPRRPRRGRAARRPCRPSRSPGRRPCGRRAAGWWRAGCRRWWTGLCRSGR